MGHEMMDVMLYRFHGSMNDSTEPSGPYTSNIRFVKMAIMPVITGLGLICSILVMTLMNRRQIKALPVCMLLSLSAAADIFKLICYQVWWIASEYSNGAAEELIPEPLCRFRALIGSASLLLLPYCTVLISIDRWVATFKPGIYKILITRRRTLAAMLLLISLTLVIAFPDFLLTGKNNGECGFQIEYSFYINRVRPYIKTLLAGIIPMVILGICNGMVILKLWKVHVRAGARNRSASAQIEKAARQSHAHRMMLQYYTAQTQRKIQQRKQSQRSTLSIETPCTRPSQISTESPFRSILAPNSKRKTREESGSVASAASGSIYSMRQQQLKRTRSLTTQRSSHSGTVRRRRKNRRLTLTLVATTLAYLIVSLPGFISECVQWQFQAQTSEPAHRLLYIQAWLVGILYGSTSLVNFVLYILCSPIFRRTMQNMLMNCGKCSKKQGQVGNNFFTGFSTTQPGSPQRKSRLSIDPRLTSDVRPQYPVSEKELVYPNQLKPY